MRVITLLYLLIIVACLNASPHTNALKFQRISVTEGLSQGNINAILSDSKGFLWFGTQDGLNRYDGYTFKVYKPSREDTNSLRSNIIKVLFEDSDGLMWVGTAGGGLSCYDRETDLFTTYYADPSDSSSISNNYIYSIFEDEKNRLWIGTFGGGLNLFDKQTNQFTVYKHHPSDSTSISGNIVRSIISAEDGDLWIGIENGGIDRFDPDNEIVVKHYENDPENTNSLSNNAVLSICKVPDGSLWIGTWAGGVNVFNPKTETFKRYTNSASDPESLASNENFVVFNDSKGRIWVSTRNGLDLYCPEIDGFKHYQNDPVDRFSLSHNHVVSIYQDQNSLMWVGTEGGGINKFSFERKNFQYNDLIIDGELKVYPNDVFSLFEDSDGIIWIGTKGGGLLRYNPNSMQLKRYVYDRKKPYSIKSNVVRAITQDSKGNLIIGTDGAGLAIFNKKTERFITYRSETAGNSLSNNAVFDVLVDSTGLIWIGTYGGGLDCFDPNTQLFENYTIDSVNLSQNVVLKIHEDKKGRLWLGTNGKGIMLFDREKRDFVDYSKDFSDVQMLSNDVVLTITDANNDGIWIGTGGNSFYYMNLDVKLIKHFSDKKANFAEMISGIIEDRKSNLWVSSNMGLFKYDVGYNRYFHFTEVEGIQGLTFNQDATLKSASGWFYMGGINGINIFHPDSIYFDVSQPEVVITDFKINNKSVKPGGSSVLEKSISETDTIRLSYQDKIISFEFAGLHYFAPKQNSYAYKLEGFEQNWNHISSDRRFATYTNLPGGTYKFRVKASNYDGIWNVEGTSIVLIIEPPYWQKTWFYIFVAFVLVVLVFIFLRLREKQFHRQQQLLENKVAVRTDEIERQKQELLTYNSMLNRQKEELKAKSESLTFINKKLNDKTQGLKEKGEELEEANGLLKRKNKFIEDSIDYAQKIQESILPSNTKLDKYFDEYFIFYRPRDVVSGDFYWFAEADKDEWGKPCSKLILACVDCTGHGVPGAFMSMIGNTLLNEIVLRQGIQDPKSILKMLNEEIISAFEKEDGQFSDDGMDISIITIDPEMQEIVVASAMQRVYLVLDGEITVVEGDIFSIGEMFAVIKKPDFTNHTFTYNDGDAVYLFSDGFQDQFGGTNNEKFREKRLRQLVKDIQHLPMKQQNDKFCERFESWKEGYNQIDDVLVMGVRLFEE